MDEFVKMVDAAIGIVNDGGDADTIIATLEELKTALQGGGDAEKSSDTDTRNAMGLKPKN